MADRSVSVLMTLSDLERRDARGHFEANLLNNSRTAGPRTTKSDSITRGDWRILGVSYAPTARGRSPSATQFRGSLLLMHTHTL